LQAAAEGVPITVVYPGVMYGPGMLTSGNLVSRVVRELSFNFLFCKNFLAMKIYVAKA
jgi:hypothetical protein